MKRPGAGFRFPFFVGLLLASGWAAGDSWMSPRTEVTLSANGQYRVIVIPRPLGGSLPYFEDKAEGVEPAGQREGETQLSPIARVEKLDSSEAWRLVWERPLVNDVAPVEVLLADDASFLVTFDNWHSVGYGDDVVVVYDRDGNPAHSFALEQLLPAAYVTHLPRSVSSRWWGRGHVLVDGDSHVELQVVQPGDRSGSGKERVRVRIRLADGEVLIPGGGAWDEAMAEANALEAQRLAAWDELRALRVAPLVAPDSADTGSWRRYLFELRDRIAAEGESMRGMVLAAPGEERGGHGARGISLWVESYNEQDEWADRSFIFVSPTSDVLAAELAAALLARAGGSMRGAHVVFVGTPAEGEQVARAAAHAGARLTAIDPTSPFPAGEPLPESPSPEWMPMPARL